MVRKYTTFYTKSLPSQRRFTWKILVEIRRYSDDINPQKDHYFAHTDVEKRHSRDWQTVLCLSGLSACVDSRQT